MKAHNQTLMVYKQLYYRWTVKYMQIFLQIVSMVIMIVQRLKWQIVNHKILNCTNTHTQARIHTCTHVWHTSTHAYLWIPKKGRMFGITTCAIFTRAFSASYPFSMQQGLRPTLLQREYVRVYKMADINVGEVGEKIFVCHPAAMERCQILIIVSWSRRQ